jgi:hypothetical protein
MGTVHETSTSVQFDTALRSLAAQATTRYAGEKARIDRGLVLALNGHVTHSRQALGSALAGAFSFQVSGRGPAPAYSRKNGAVWASLQRLQGGTSPTESPTGESVPGILCPMQGRCGLRPEGIGDAPTGNWPCRPTAYPSRL